MPHSAQPQPTNYWAPRMRKRHQQEHRPQRPTECSNPTQHAKGRTGDCPGPCKGTPTRRNVRQGGGGGFSVHVCPTHTETQRGRLWTACGQRHVDSKNSQMTPATTSTSSICQLLGAADVQTAHHATFSTAPTHQLLGSTNAETTPARAPAAAADRTQQPDATREGKNG